MSRLIFFPAAAAVAALAAACAPTADTGAPGDSAAARPVTQCFSADQVRNFRSGNAGQLYIRAMRDQVFELNTSGGCLDLDFAQQMAITPDGASLAGGRICTGDGARITLPGSAPSLQSCRARVSRMLTEAEVAALPSAHRP